MKFKINNKIWVIKEISQNEMKEELKKHCEIPTEQGKYFGLTYFDIQTIFLDKDLEFEKLKEILEKKMKENERKKVEFLGSGLNFWNIAVDFSDNNIYRSFFALS